MNLDRIQELQEWKQKAKALAYRWFRHRFPEASHKKAWKFANLAWPRFFKKRPQDAVKTAATKTTELSPDDTALPV